MKITGCLAATLPALLLAAPAWALRISPSVARLDPSGPGSTRVLSIANESGRPCHLRLEALVMAIDIDGDETTIPVRSLRVEPRELRVGPHRHATVRVSWAGDPRLDKELAFRVVATEAGAGKKAPGIDLAPMTVYETPAYVTPPGAAPASSVESFRVLPDGKGELVLNNSGTAHQALDNLNLAVKRENGAGVEETIQFRPKLPAVPDGANLPPASARRYVIELPKQLAAIPGPLHAEAEFR